MRVFVLVGLSLFARVAAAEVCVVLDEQRDTLSPDDRRAATLSLMQALQKNGERVTTQGCAGTYTFYHVKLGATISVYLYGPTGAYREARAAKLEELPLVYEQMVVAMRTGQSMATGGGTVDRYNATIDQMAPRRVQSDDLKYVRLGYGTVAGGSVFGGPAFGFGWRHELDRIGIDLSFINFIIAAESKPNESAINFGGNWVQLETLFFFDPMGSNTLYLGGGISWGATAIYEEGMTSNTRISGSGLQGQVTGGFEMFRSSTLRLFLEADATLPFYYCTPDFSGSNISRYTPSFLIRAGTGWGKSNTLQVVNR